MQLLLAKFFAWFKTKNPTVYAVLIIVIGAVYGLQQAGVLHLPQAIIDVLVGLGLITGTHTTSVIEKNETK